MTGPEGIHYSPLCLVADDSPQLLIFCEVLTILVSTFFDLADVAQLVEQPIRNRQVTSSSLVVGSNLPLTISISISNSLSADNRLRSQHLRIGLKVAQLAFLVSTMASLVVFPFALFTDIDLPLTLA